MKTPWRRRVSSQLFFHFFFDCSSIVLGYVLGYDLGFDLGFVDLGFDFDLIFKFSSHQCPKEIR